MVWFKLNATPMNMLLDTLAIAFGVVAVVSPRLAAKIWGAERLDGLTAKGRTSFLRWYRIFGVVLVLAGALSAVDSIWFSNSL
jgi:hypothetical protein